MMYRLLGPGGNHTNGSGKAHNLQALTMIAFFLLALAPVGLALRYGDSLLDRFARSRRESRKRSRQKKTLALPIRSHEVERLLDAEGKRDAIDERIAASLEAFSRLSSGRSREDSETEIEKIEQAILTRESQFNTYLDYAWLQSETLEILTEEARLLRKLADLPEEGLPFPPAEPGESRPQTASDKLIAGLQDALDRKAKADGRLRQVGQQSQRPGGRFDATIGDERHP